MISIKHGIMNDESRANAEREREKSDQDPSAPKTERTSYNPT